MGSIEISNEKSREQRTLFDEFRSHYFCTVLYVPFAMQRKNPWSIYYISVSHRVSFGKNCYLG